MAENPKPLYLIKPGSVKPKDIRRAEKLCGIIICECDDPSNTKQVDALVVPRNMDALGRASLRLIRFLANDGGLYSTGEISRKLAGFIADESNVPPK